MHRLDVAVLMMLKRKIEKDIMHWIDSSDTAPDSGCYNFYPNSFI